MANKEKAASLHSILSNVPEANLFNTLFYMAIKENLSIAIWRTPHDTFTHLVVDFSQGRKFEIDELEDLTQGFIMAPFYDSGSPVFINGDIRISTDGSAHRVYSMNVSEDSMLMLEKALNSKEKHNIAEPPMATSTTQSEYISWVSAAINQIKKGKFKKVVPARILVKEWNGSPVETFLKLSRKHPNAFVSLVFTPASGCWIGATPELLLQVDESRIFKTSALAGTQAFNEKIDLHDVAWTQKEIEEQAMVSRYIINCFKVIRLREFEEEGPRTVKAGNLVHLKTDFMVDMKATNFPNLGSVMLRLLHPTSAVCGMPKDSASQFLKEKENFARSYFSGYLGPVNFDERTHIFVNIRCARIFNQQAFIYAGAGVTSYSRAESEWEETELKCKTLLDVMS